MANDFQRYRVWPEDHLEESGVYAFGRNAIEAAEEAFLSFIDIAEAPDKIVLRCRSDRTSMLEHVTVEPAFQPPFAPMVQQPEFAW